MILRRHRDTDGGKAASRAYSKAIAVTEWLVFLRQAESQYEK